MANEKQPIVSEQYADNGEFSHWHLIEPETGEVLWSSFPEETIAKGQKIPTRDATIRQLTQEVEKLKGYATHLFGCGLNTFRGLACTCGLNELVNK